MIIESNELFQCEQCGKMVSKSNKFSINYNGKHMILCGKHYAQYQKNREFIDDFPRSNHDRNDYEITDEGVWINCYNRQNKFTDKFLIDLDDLERVKDHKWRCWKKRFFTGNFKPISIHTFLLNPKEGQVIDHINGNPADNRRCNLRITTQDKNCINKDLQSNNTSGVAGVSWDKARNRWAPEIAIKRKRCHLGRYQKFEDAVYARYIAELVIFDDFRSFRNDDKILNIIDNCNKKEDIDTYVVNKLYQKNLLDID